MAKVTAKTTRAEKWINAHLKRLRAESKTFPKWMQRRMKPPRENR